MKKVNDKQEIVKVLQELVHAKNDKEIITVLRMNTELFTNLYYLEYVQADGAVEEKKVLDGAVNHLIKLLNKKEKTK